MTVVVQEGRFYRDGGGEKRGPMGRSGDPVFPWRCPTSRFTYTNDGMYFSDDVGSLYDLIAEWEEEPKTDEAPKLLRDMTDAEFGALLRAQHRGKVIECCKPGSTFGSEWESCDPMWLPNWAYRVRSEPKRDTVKLYSEDAYVWSSNLPVEKARWRLILTVIDGEPSDPKLEALE